MSLPGDVRMLVNVKRDEDSLDGQRYRVTVRPVRVSEEAGGKQSVSDYLGYDDPVDQLEVAAFGNLDSDDPPIGWRVYYRGAHFVDLAGAREMVDMLRKIDRGVERFNRKVGRAESFGGYVARVGATLGIDQYGFAAPRGEKMWANGETYRWETADTIATTIGWRIDSLRQTQRSAAA